MDNEENYTSLQEFSEDRATQRILNNNTSGQGLKGRAECLKGHTTCFVIVGLLASICANIVLTMLLFNRPFPGTTQEAVALTMKLNSVQSRYVRLCDDYIQLADGCSKTVKKCRECPEGWMHTGDKCYYFSNDKKDWLGSRDSCTEMGSHLTILHTHEQHDALGKEARRIGGMEYHFWIGLSDMEKEGDWRWVDNTTLKNKYWNQWSPEPNNHQSGGGHGEDCATLDSHSKSWFDVPCEHIYKRICQMDAIQLS
ncbi:C-type lectin domain family 4 member E-like [Aplochiton taeniatus]